MNASVGTRNRIRLSQSDKWFYRIQNIFVTLILIMVLYPLIFVVSSSLSDPNKIAGRGVLLLPIGFSFDGYKAVFEYSDVLIGYRNTILYTAIGTLINVTLTIGCAYPLARK